MQHCIGRPSGALSRTCHVVCICSPCWLKASAVWPLPLFVRMGEEPSRATKLRRLDVFRKKVPHMSTSALSSLIDAIGKEGVPE